MAVETDVDRLSLLSDWGEDATVQGVTVRGILDQEFRDNGGIESLYPVFECRTSDVPAVQHGHSVIAGGDNFEVVGVEDDGEGFTLLILIKV